MDIEELKELEAKATPGPWEARWNGTLGRASITAGKPISLQAEVHRCGYGNQPPEAELIVILRNLAPELMALWEAVNQQQAARAGRSCHSVIRRAIDALNKKARG
jgi:hypothetical protein